MTVLPNLAKLLPLVVPCLIACIGLYAGGPKIGHAQAIPQSAAEENQTDPLLGDIFDQGRPGVNPDLIPRKWLDLAYAGLSPSQKLDIYLPDTGKGPYPVIMAIHGGSFYRGDKRDFQILPMLAARDRGYAVVSVNYRLSGEATFPSQIHDIKAAIRWIRANGARYALSPDKIALWGDSAGGNLAALAGTSGKVPALEDLSMGNPDVPSAVQAVVDWYGPINLMTVASQLNKKNIAKKASPATAFIGKSKEEAPELYIAENPETYIAADNPPFYIQHGDADTLVATQQSIDFAAKLEKVLGKDKVTLEVIKGAGHLGAAFNSPENIAKVLDFFDKYLK